MRHLFHSWSHVSRRLRSAGRIALFLDFDGTLARLEPRPEQVLLKGSVRQALAALARSPRFRICVISGRRQADVRARIHVPGIRYLGLHGWEGRGAALAEETRGYLAGLLSCMESAFADVPGVWIENKEYAFAVHYADAMETEAVRVRAIIEGIIEPYLGHYRIQGGKNVWEILPRALEDKGAAVKQQLALLRGRWLAVYLGDDQVDEPAFAVLRTGITVRVGPRCQTHAQYRLSGVADVRTFLHRLRTEFA